MGVPQKAVAWISPEEYLALEERATFKHEYLDGVIYAWQGHVPEGMAGGTRAHNKLCQNLLLAFRQHLRGSPCEVYITDVRLHVRARDAYFYPDLAVTCSPADRSTDSAEASVFREPCLIVEVLSDSTEVFDRGEKFAAYKQIPTFEEYLLVSARGRRMEVFRRQPAGTWTHSEYRGAPARLDSIGLTIDPEAVYGGVEL
jgi:Uma2 family endonuclease